MKHDVSLGESQVAEAAHTEEPSTSVKDESEELPENVLRVLDGAASAPQTMALPKSVEAPASAFGGLGIGRVLQVRDDDLDVIIGGNIVAAKCHPTLHPSVVKTARESGEPVLVERSQDGSLVVMGALRTKPTPGVDAIEDLTIEADRIHLRGKKELLLSTAGVASIALRAAGEIETYADRIVSRAEELHKIVGRMLRLN